MKARKVKAHVMRVIDGDEWTILSVEVNRLESIAKAPRVAGADAIPTAASDDQTKVDFLNKSADRIRDALDRAKNLGDKEKQIASDQAARAIESARDVLRPIAQAHVDLADPIVQANKTIANKLDSAAEAAKSLVPWYLAIGVVAWIAIGVGVYALFQYNEKTYPRRKRAVESAARIYRGG